MTQQPEGSSTTVAGSRSLRVPVVLAGLLTAAGVVATTYGALTHTAVLIAPGSAVILAGSAWLGFALACLDVRLLPSGLPKQLPDGADGAP